MPRVKFSDFVLSLREPFDSAGEYSSTKRFIDNSNELRELYSSKYINSKNRKKSNI